MLTIASGAGLTTIFALAKYQYIPLGNHLFIPIVWWFPFSDHGSSEPDCTFTSLLTHRKNAVSPGSVNSNLLDSNML